MGHEDRKNRCLNYYVIYCFTYQKRFIVCSTKFYFQLLNLASFIKPASQIIKMVQEKLKMALFKELYALQIDYPF